MIQLTFDASTPEEALGHQPTMLSYAQHSSGENAQWDDDNVQREDGHLLTFPGEGSHADHYQSAVWLAWGRRWIGLRLRPIAGRIAGSEAQDNRRAANDRSARTVCLGALSGPVGRISPLAVQMDL